MSPIVLILVVILIFVLLGGGYGYRRGNNALAGGGGLVGLILIILLILFLMGQYTTVIESPSGRVRGSPPLSIQALQQTHRRGSSAFESSRGGARPRHGRRPRARTVYPCGEVAGARGRGRCAFPRRRNHVRCPAASPQ